MNEGHPTRARTQNVLYGIKTRPLYLFLEQSITGLFRIIAFQISKPSLFSFNARIG
jgi:hypothetical protein